MRYSLAAALSNDNLTIIFGILFIGVILLIVGFLLFQSRANHILRKSMRDDLSKVQGELFNTAADMLAKKLTAYTDRVLVEKVKANYDQLISQELLPSVNAAADKIAELADAVTRRQEEGISKLAEELAGQMAAKTRDYIRQEAIIITSLQDSTVQFTKQLDKITTSTEDMTAHLQEIYNRAAEVSASAAGTADSLSEKMASLTTVLDNTLAAVQRTQESVQDSCSAAKNLGDTTLEMQRLAGETSSSLTHQNEKIARLLADTISTMRENTEQATKMVLKDFGSQLNYATTSITDTIASLQSIADGIRLSATQFADSLAGSYNTISSSLEEKIVGVTDKVSATVADEYEKIRRSAEAYSSDFSQGLQELHSSLEGHISNLQTVTQQLNNNVSSFKNDVDTSSSRFELGMEKSVSEALSQMDTSLAEIVQRLVTVTNSIQEAADALPKAVKAIK